MSYTTWITQKFPSVLSLRIAENSREGRVAIFSLKDREFNLTNIIDDLLAIYNTIELYDNTLFFDRFYFIFKDTTTNKFKVVSAVNIQLLQYCNKQISYEILEKHINVEDIKLRTHDNGTAA